MSGALLLLAAVQILATLVILVRLGPGARRAPPVAPRPDDSVADTTVSVLVPTLNEADRLAPCLAGLAKQGSLLTEVLVIDSGSTDGTVELVRRATLRDPRVRLLHDPPLASGWIGKVWALQHGLAASHGEWILGIDADTEPELGMVAAAVRAARDAGLSLVSFSPRFAGQTVGQRWLHPAMLLTLVYRFGPPSPNGRPQRRMANGQCMLVSRAALSRHGGYAPSRASFADDVMLARHYAANGEAVGFLDGSKLYSVRSYATLRQLWREWGRSIDLSDATPARTQLADLVLLVLVQALPLPLLAAVAFGAFGPWSQWSTVARAVVLLNGFLLLVRVGLLAAVAGAYERRGIAYWLSPFADVAAVARIVISTVRRPRQWRGRDYASLAQSSFDPNRTAGSAGTLPADRP